MSGGWRPGEHGGIGHAGDDIAITSAMLPLSPPGHHSSGHGAYACRALVGVGSSATEEAPWSPQGQLASNVGSRRSSRPMSRATRA